MKYQTIISLILLPRLAPALGAAVTNSDSSQIGMQKRGIEDAVVDKLNHARDQKAKALEVAGQGVKVVGKGIEAVGEWVKVVGNEVKTVGGEGIRVVGEGVKAVGEEIKKVPEELRKTFTPEPGPKGDLDKFGDILPACAESDCKNTTFMNEAVRWIKQAFKDIAAFVHKNLFNTAVIVIGVSVLLVELISGGFLTPIALEAIGFGIKGPVRGTIAAAVQRVINPVKLGSVFSQLQSAAMNGAARKELQRHAHIAIAGLIGAGVAGLVETGIRPHDRSTGHQDWRTWELESRVDTLSDFTSHATWLWGTPTYGGCIAYGYREVRAPLSFIPEDIDPLAFCAQTPASIEHIGFKTPLRCIVEGHEKGVTGLWYVPTNATACMPTWSTFEDEGCVLYGRRRKFARLMGLKNDDWKNMCQSTPAIIGDKYYDQPSHCDDKGPLGIYGVFDIVDEQCECSCVRT